MTSAAKWESSAGNAPCPEIPFHVFVLKIGLFRMEFGLQQKLIKTAP
jgi:hypothetical protein